MFENGLLATFIPEFLMILGYVMCLIAPSSTVNSAVEVVKNNPSIVEYTYLEKQSTALTTYQVYISYFQIEGFISSESDTKHSFISIEKIKLFCDCNSKLSEGLTFKQFTRPPPFCC